MITLPDPRDATRMIELEIPADCEYFQRGVLKPVWNFVMPPGRGIEIRICAELPIIAAVAAEWWDAKAQFEMSQKDDTYRAYARRWRLFTAQPTLDSALEN